MNFLSWLKKGSLAVIDQGLFSGANFIVNILLARWLTPEEYGAFAVAMSVFYLLAGFHTAVLTEPMMVFGAGKYRESFRKYLGMLLYGHWGIAAIISLALGVAALVTSHYDSKVLSHALAGLAIASPFLLLFWLARRACYVPMRPVWAVIGSAVNLVVVVVGVFFLWRASLLSGFSGLVLLGVAAVVASLVALAPVRPQVVGFAGNPTVGMVAADHRGYGSWNILAVAAYWASGQILMLLIPIFLGLAASAVVAAVWNLYRPVSLFMQSLGLVILPTFSRWVDQGVPASELKRRVSRMALLFGVGVALYGLILTAAAKPVLHFLYTGKYDEHWVLVGLFGLSSAMSVATGMFVSLLKAHGRVDVVSAIWMMGVLLTAVLSVPFMYLAGVEGAVVAAFIAYTVAFWRAIKKVEVSK
ncbi:MAG: hypothetical protein KatS3mg078_1675 [Deltaproteobacteria bacterium]|nr:MAG: hypothetical protein KatS3mg078_1675 [Deltaproteobacteria bacterium]